MSAALLIVEHPLRPRWHLDKGNLSSIQHALEAGLTLPPVVVDEDSLRVVDGVHRVTAVLHIDTGAEIEVELRRYADDDALWLDAIELNSHHGARLSSYDQALVLAVSEARKMPRERIAQALGLTIDKCAAIRQSRTAYDADGRPVMIKRSARHLAGRRLSAEQVEANEKASGWPVSFHAEQIINSLQGGLVDWDDPATTEALRRLADALATHLAAMA
jgi:ParB-like chromosome segregation protein Spo0J